MREDNGKEETRAKVQTEADKYVRWSREETTLGERISVLFAARHT